jgi:hypothetical protein
LGRKFMSFRSTSLEFISRFIIAASIAGALTISGIAMATDLVTDDGYTYDIDDNTGELNDGEGPGGLDDACDDCWELFVDGNGFNTTLDSTDLGGRELVHGVEVISGLNVSRRTYVPQTESFVRYLNILENPTGAPIMVTVRVETNLGSDDSTTVIATSSGDLVADAMDRWAATNGDSADPRVAHVWDGLGGTDSVDYAEVGSSSEDDVDWEWQTVTVPANSTVIYMSLGSMQSSGAAATQAATRLGAVGSPSILDGLDAMEIAQIQNWDLADDDMDGLPGGYETFYGLDDDVAGDAALDGDMDGLTALAEFNNSTDPTDADTDNDGLSDGDELNVYGTSPINDDSDADGIGDGGEINSGLDPLDPSDGEGAAIGTLISDGVLDSDRPWAAEDAAGNIHVVWAPNSSDDFIRYKMLDSDLNTLIDETIIGDQTGSTVAGQRPQIEIGSDGKAYVLWQDDCEVWLQRLDPSLDDQNGDAADPAVLVEANADLDGGSCIYHLKFVLDTNNNLYIVSETGSEVQYSKFDSDGAELVAYTDVALVTDDHRTPSIGIDSNGNVHIAWTDDSTTTEEELYYAMLNGSDGSVLIDATLLSPDDGDADKHTSLIVDNDLVTIVWGGCCTGSVAQEIYLTRLDPSLDDQSGDAADPMAITTVAQTRLTSDDGENNWYITATQDADGNLNITDGAGSNTSGSAVSFLKTDLVGNVLIAEQDVNTGGSSYYSYQNYSPAIDSGIYIREDVAGVESIARYATPTVSEIVAAATGSGVVIVATDSGRLSVVEPLALTDLPGAAQTDVPTDETFDDGFFRIVIATVPVGGTANVTLDLPGAYTAGTDPYYEWTANGGWVALPYTNGANTNQVVLALTDGGAGDADGIANGQIIQTGGPSVAGEGAPPTTPPTTPPSGGAPADDSDNFFGCTMGSGNGPVDPTLPVLLLVALAFLTRRRWMRVRLF